VKLETISSSNVDIIWVAVDIAKENKLEDAMKIVRHYRHHPDPKSDDDVSLKISKGEEVRFITTIRGTLPWLLHSILVKFNTDYYPEAINIIEELARDDSPYVRMNSTVPLEFLTKNLLATKHPNETPFNFLPEDKKRVYDLSFEMLRTNKHLSRVLEYLASVFANLRLLNETEAREVLQTFFYKDEETLREEYVLERFVPLAIYYAIYRVNRGDDFNKTWFEEFLKKLLTKPDKRLKSNITWHFWKELSSNPESYELIKGYIPLVLADDLESENFSQVNFLMREVSKIDLGLAITILNTQLKFVVQKSSQEDIRTGRWWFHELEEVVEKIAVNKPELLIESLEQIKNAHSLGIYVGDIYKIFLTYKLTPEKIRPRIEKEAKEIYSKLRNVNEKLMELQ